MYVLTIGWHKFCFDSPVEAAKIMETLVKAPVIDTAYVGNDIVTYYTKATISLEASALRPEAILPDYAAVEALKAARAAAAAEPRKDEPYGDE